MGSGPSLFGRIKTSSSARNARSQDLPITGGEAELRAGIRLYRSMFLRTEGDCWVFAVPPDSKLKEDQSVKVLLPTTRGPRSFEAKVAPATGEAELRLVRSGRIRTAERRSAGRQADFVGATILLDGELAHLIDLSEGGARVEAKRFQPSGVRVCLQVPKLGDLYGWILESTPAGESTVFRIRFEEPAPL